MPVDDYGCGLHVRCKIEALEELPSNEESAAARPGIVRTTRNPVSIGAKRLSG